MCIVRERPHPDSREALQRKAKTFSLLEAAGALGSLDTSHIHSGPGGRLGDSERVQAEFRHAYRDVSFMDNVALVSIPRGGDLAQLIFNVLHTLGIPSCPELSLDSWCSYLRGLSMGDTP